MKVLDIQVKTMPLEHKQVNEAPDIRGTYQIAKSFVDWGLLSI